MKTIIAAILASAIAILAGCTSTHIKTANGTEISRTALGTNTQLGKLNVDLRADGSGTLGVESLSNDQTSATNALIAALVSRLPIAPAAK